MQIIRPRIISNNDLLIIDEDYSDNAARVKVARKVINPVEKITKNIIENIINSSYICVDFR